MIRFAGKLALQQRVLPSYRVPFFDLLAFAVEGKALHRRKNYRIQITNWDETSICSAARFIFVTSAVSLTGWKTATRMR